MVLKLFSQSLGDFAILQASYSPGYGSRGPPEITRCHDAVHSAQIEAPIWGSSEGVAIYSLCKGDDLYGEMEIDVVGGLVTKDSEDLKTT